MNNFLPSFLDGASGILELWQTACLDLQTNPDAKGVDRLYSLVTRLNLVAKSVGLNSYSEIVEDVGKLLIALKDGRIHLDSVVVGLLHESHSVLVKWTDLLRFDEQAVFEIGDLTTRLRTTYRDQHRNTHHLDNFGPIFSRSKSAHKVEASGDVNFKKYNFVEQIVSDQVIGNRTQGSEKTAEFLSSSSAKLDDVVSMIKDLAGQIELVKDAISKLQSFTAHAFSKNGGSFDNAGHRILPASDAPREHNHGFVSALIIRLGDVNYAVPSQDISEVVDLSLCVVQIIRKRRVLRYRDQFLPIERLADYLPLGHIASGSPKIALIVNADERPVAFEVDRVECQQSIVIQDLGYRNVVIPGFAGASILENGDPVMVLKIPHIVRSFLAFAG